MKKYSDYQIYGALAMLTIALCWCWVAWVPLNNYQQQLEEGNLLMERSLAMVKERAKELDDEAIKDVKKNGNSEEGLERLDRGKLLRKRTQAVIDQIEQLKQGIKTNQKAYWVMVEQGNALKIDQLTQEHIQWLNHEYRDLDISKFKLNRSTREFISAKRHFSHATSTGAIAWLNQRALAVRHFEHRIARKLLGAFSFSCNWFTNSYDPMVFPKYKQIQVGDEYNADLFMSKAVSKSRPRMTSYGQPIAVADGMSTVDIPTQKSGKFYWSGTITYYDTHTKKDSTVTFHQFYQVIPQNK